MLMICALNGHVQREIGSSHTMKSGRLASARAMPMTLPLSAGKFVGVAVQVVLLEAHLLDQAAHALRDLRRIHALVLERLRDDAVRRSCAG
jgi:hypothetical protein